MTWWHRRKVTGPRARHALQHTAEREHASLCLLNPFIWMCFTLSCFIKLRKKQSTNRNHSKWLFLNSPYSKEPEWINQKKIKQWFEKPESWSLTSISEGWSFRTCSLAINSSWFLWEKNEHFTFKGKLTCVLRQTHVATLHNESTRVTFILQDILHSDLLI